ncbi:MAG TPA: hypothetical protein VH062_35315 [Polyangiaceae bacterium]|jgi:hypothetical protein|nr:hypothetical protein [Polyangiaceae bacterium]
MTILVVERNDLPLGALVLTELAAHDDGTTEEAGLAALVASALFGTEDDEDDFADPDRDDLAGRLSYSVSHLATSFTVTSFGPGWRPALSRLATAVLRPPTVAAMS